MPFDATPTKQDTRPIMRLIEVLRGPEPNGWNFVNASHCAIPIYRRMGFNPVDLGFRGIGGFFRGARIFGVWTAFYRPAIAYLVRPRHVAAALEHYDRTGEALSPCEFARREIVP